MYAPGVILLRAGAAVALGLVVAFVTWCPPSRKSWVTSWGVPLLGAAGWLFLVVGALVIGRTLATYYLPDWFHGSGLARGALDIVAVIVVALAPVYAAVMATQVIANAARRIKGQKPQKLEWIRRPPRKRKPKARA